jgi:hypothetical protein
MVVSSSDQAAAAISDYNNSITGNDSGSSESKGPEADRSDLKRNPSKTVSIVNTLHEDEDSGVRMEERWIQEHQITPFLFLSLDIPPTPLFKVE